MSTRRPMLPRLLHPLAWWAWGVGLAVVASRTTNPVLLLLVIAVAVLVTVARQELSTPNVLRVFLILGLFIIAFRLVMAVLLGAGIRGRTVLFTLPEVPLPELLSTIRIGGPVTAERLLYALYDALQLTAILVAVGAANALASPRRVLRYLPATLYDLGTAAVVALSYAPQLADDALRVRTARRLRGHDGRGVREVARLTVPVLDSSLERSLELAASMESRGYGRAVHRSTARRRAGSALTVIGTLGTVIGMYGVLEPSQPAALGLPMLLGGAGLAAAALLVGARRDHRSSYRRDPWTWPESLVLATALVPALVLMLVGGRADAGLATSVQPLAWPTVNPWVVVVLLIPALAGFITPMPPARAEAMGART